MFVRVIDRDESNNNNHKKDIIFVSYYMKIMTRGRYIDTKNNVVFNVFADLGDTVGVYFWQHGIVFWVPNKNALLQTVFLAILPTGYYLRGIIGMTRGVRFV